MWSRAVSLFNYCTPNTSNFIYRDRTILSYCHKYPFCLERFHSERHSAHPDPSLCEKSAGWLNAYKHSARCDKVTSTPCATVKSPCFYEMLNFSNKTGDLSPAGCLQPLNSTKPLQRVQHEHSVSAVCLISLQGRLWIFQDKAVVWRSKQGKKEARLFVSTSVILQVLHAGLIVMIWCVLV